MLAISCVQGQKKDQQDRLKDRLRHQKNPPLLGLDIPDLEFNHMRRPWPLIQIAFQLLQRIFIALCFSGNLSFKEYSLTTFQVRG